jgi:hypothetical protein
MLAADIVKHWVFSDTDRRLQQTSNDATSGSAFSTIFIVMGMSMSGFVIICIVAIKCCRILVEIRSLSTTERSGTAMDATTTPEFSTDNTLHKTPRKSSLAERKQAILELFESAQVTMVSNYRTVGDEARGIQGNDKAHCNMSCSSVQKVTEDDIYRAESCVDDVESGFDEGGILKLSRSVVVIVNPTADAYFLSPLPPPEWSGVPNMCAICLDSYQPGQGVAWSSVCMHAFHQDCISHYLAKKMIGGETPCPSCRQKFCELPEELKKMSTSSISGNSATLSSALTEAGTY